MDSLAVLGAWDANEPQQSCPRAPRGSSQQCAPQPCQSPPPVASKEVTLVRSTLGLKPRRGGRQTLRVRVPFGQTGPQLTWGRKTNIGTPLGGWSQLLYIITSGKDAPEPFPCRPPCQWGPAQNVPMSLSVFRTPRVWHPGMKGKGCERCSGN